MNRYISSPPSLFVVLTLFLASFDGYGSIFEMEILVQVEVQNPRAYKMVTEEYKG